MIFKDFLLVLLRFICYNKLLNNYPIQYLIGYVNFYGNNIKVKEKKSREQAKCICKPSINIIFTKKVNSVTVTTADGIKLRQCN